MLVVELTPHGCGIAGGTAMVKLPNGIITRTIALIPDFREEAGAYVLHGMREMQPQNLSGLNVQLPLWLPDIT